VIIFLIFIKILTQFFDLCAFFRSGSLIGNLALGLRGGGGAGGCDSFRRSRGLRRLGERRSGFGFGPEQIQAFALLSKVSMEASQQESRVGCFPIFKHYSQ